MIAPNLFAQPLAVLSLLFTVGPETTARPSDGEWPDAWTRDTYRSREGCYREEDLSFFFDLQVDKHMTPRRIPVDIEYRALLEERRIDRRPWPLRRVHAHFRQVRSRAPHTACRRLAAKRKQKRAYAR